MSEIKFVDISKIENDEKYAEAMIQARMAAERTMNMTLTPQQRDAWARASQAWVAIAREIREARA